jgi:hypothetical protein
MHWSHIGLYLLVVAIEQIPRTSPFKSNPWTIFTSIPTKPEKNGILYVALSRVKSLVDLQILEPLSHIVLKYFQPRNVHLVEDKHL